MPASINWHPKRNGVLLMLFEGQVTLTEAIEVSRQESQFIQQANSPIHTIIETRQITSIPPDFLSSLPRISSMPAVNHPNAGQKIVVGASGIIATFLNIFSRLYKKLEMVATMEEAEQLLDTLIHPS